MEERQRLTAALEKIPSLGQVVDDNAKTSLILEPLLGYTQCGLKTWNVRARVGKNTTRFHISSEGQSQKWV